MLSRGMEAASKGMLGLIELNDTIANNIANVNTTGFKKANLLFRNIYDAAIEKVNLTDNPKNASYRHLGKMSMGSATHLLLNEFSQGTLSPTGNPLDLGIEGDGFFKVMSQDGEVSYTRNGSFAIDTKNMLVDEEGNYVLDVFSRPIKIDLNQGDLRSKNDIVISEEGRIELNLREGKMMLQQIGVYDFQNKEDLRALGASRFVPKNIGVNPEIKAEKFTIQQGTIETSNSNIIREMVNMINVSRNYETLSKFVKNESDSLSKAINLARVNI